MWRGLAQLRLQAHGNTARRGLAGRSLTCKRGFGLALQRAGGERHRARGRVASNRARDMGFHTTRGGWKTALKRRLEEGCYRGKRERERERCVSAADASTYGPMRARNDPRHICPRRTHVKQSLFMRSGTSPRCHSSAKALETSPEDRPKPDLSLIRAPTGAMTSVNIQSTVSLVKSEPQIAAQNMSRVRQDRPL
jgi:hypothetical protein